LRILLCLTPEFHSETPPLGLAYLKSSLMRKGHDVLCLDFSQGYNRLSFPMGSSESVQEEGARYQEAVESWADKIERLSPDMVGITLWSSTRVTACLLADAVRKRLPHVCVLGGGPDFLERDPEGYLNSFDYVIEKEGETAICDFADEYRAQGGVTETRGVWTKSGGEIHRTGPGERISNLDELPIPDFSDFDLATYSEGLPVMFSRGCDANCTFCTNKKYFKRQVSRSGENMIREILRHRERTGSERFVFSDDSLLSTKNLDEFMVFCRLAAKSRDPFTWRVYGQRVFPAIKKKHVKRMKQAGLDRITFGVESFSERVRQDMGKVASDEVTRRVLFDFVDQGVQVSLLMIYGYPIETEEDFQKTLTWIERRGHRFSHICFSAFVITPEYLARRPGVVSSEGDGRHPLLWRSESVDPAVRKERFLRLAATLQGLGVEYMISDPLAGKYYRNWDARTQAEFEEDWIRSFS